MRRIGDCHDSCQKEIIIGDDVSNSYTKNTMDIPPKLQILLPSRPTQYERFLCSPPRILYLPVSTSSKTNIVFPIIYFQPGLGSIIAV